MSDNRPRHAHRGAWARAKKPDREHGFTLVELLVAMTLFLVLGGVVLTAVITMSKALDQERSTSDITAEARVAIERMSRELRQANDLKNPQLTSVKLGIDYDGSGTDNGTLADPEVVTYAYDVSSNSIAMTAQDAGGATLTEALLAGHVQSLQLKYFSSNWVKYPTQGGEVTNLPAGFQDIDRVDIQLIVTRDGHPETFRTQVTLRNRSQT